MPDIKSHAEKLISMAMSKGATHAEAYISYFKSIRAEYKGEGPGALMSSEGLAYGLRVIRDNRMGFSYSNMLNDMDNVARNAFEATSFTEPDEDLLLATPDHETQYPGLDTLDPMVAEVTEDRAIEYATKVAEAARELGGEAQINIRKASASFGSTTVHVANSNGMSAGFDATSLGASIQVAAIKDGDSQMGWGHSASRWLNGLDFKGVGHEGAHKAIEMLGAVSPASGKYSIVLDNSVATEILSLVASMLSAENVQKRKSLLEGRVGQRIISDKVNITDNPLLKGIPSMRPMDAEGVPTRSNALVKDGVLLGYMHNSYTAGKAGVHSTANAIRGGAMSMPSVGPLGMYFEAASGLSPLNRDELITSAGEGLLVTDAMGVHTINPISGDFSIGVSGLWINSGKLAHPVKEAVMAGSILGLLSNIEALGDDLRFFGSMGSPSVLVRDISLSA